MNSKDSRASIPANTRRVSEAVVEIVASEIGLSSDMLDCDTLRIVVVFTPENRRPSTRSIVVPMDFVASDVRSRY